MVTAAGPAVTDVTETEVHRLVLSAAAVPVGAVVVICEGGDRGDDKYEITRLSVQLFARPGPDGETLVLRSGDIPPHARFTPVHVYTPAGAPPLTEYAVFYAGATATTFRAFRTNTGGYVTARNCTPAGQAWAIPALAQLVPVTEIGKGEAP